MIRIMFSGLLLLIILKPVFHLKKKHNQIVRTKKIDNVFLIFFNI